MSNTGHTEKTLIFLHIPKAAGTTLHQVLEWQYPRRSIFTVDGAHVQESIQELKNLPEFKRARLRCVKGHLPFGLHHHLPRPATYITVLRDPIDRIISHYYFVLQTPKHYLYRNIVSQKMTLEQYVRSGLSPELDNGQVRFLCGNPRVDAVSGRDPVSREDLLSAKKNLKECFIGVGLSERFDETVLMFSKLLDWKHVYYAKENVTGKRSSKPTISKSVIQAIEENNDLDMELYKYAKGMFFDLNQKYGVDQEELKLFKKRNRYFGMAYKLSLVGLPKKVVRRMIRIYKEKTVYKKYSMSTEER